MSELHPLRIVVFSSSLGLRMRPPQQGPGELLYAEHLERLLAARLERPVLVHLFARVAGTLEDMNLWHEEICRCRPRYFIYHGGLVDSAPRGTGRAAWYWFHDDFYFGPSLGRIRFKRLMHRFYYLVLKRVLMPLYLPRVWIPPHQFRPMLRKVFAYVRKETRARILCVESIPYDRRVDDLLPGATRNANAYAQIIREVCAEAEGDVLFLAKEAVFGSGDPAALAELTPDGIHLNAQGHERLGRHLAELICRLEAEASTPAAGG